VSPANLLKASIFTILLALLSYVVIFRGGFSNNSTDWAAFGNYLSGIAGMVNIMIFISITLLIKQIERKNKKEELYIEQRKEIFIRFLDAYEKMVFELYKLKNYLAKSAFSESGPDIQQIEEFYEKIKTLQTLASFYLPSEPIDFSGFLEKYAHLLASLTQNNDVQTRKKAGKDLLQQIDGLIINVNAAINIFLTKTSEINE
jgi:hypothetical protein